MTDRQFLKALGLRETELRDIRYVNREYQDSQAEIESAYIAEGREFSLPSVDYTMVRERLEARGLSGKEAREYTHQLLKDYMSELVNIWETGHTSAYRNAYQAVADYAGLSLEQFRDLKYSDKVGYCKSFYYELTGEEADGSDVAYLLQQIQEALDEVDNE